MEMETKSVVCITAKRESKTRYYYDFYLVDNNTDSMCKASSMFSSDLPNMFGWAYLYPYIYIVGGKYLNRESTNIENPINHVYVFDCNSANSKWEKLSECMNGSRVCPFVIPIVKQNRLYVFGCTTSNDEDWAEYYDPNKNKWKSLPIAPDEVLKSNNELMGYAVVNNENQIILWNSYFFFALNLETDIPTWELQPNIGKKPTLHFTPYFAVVKDVLYYFCKDRLYAYDLAANHSFDGPIYNIDTSFMDAYSFEQFGYDRYFLFGTRENDLCIIWSNHTDNNTKDNMDVFFVKLRIERFDADASVGEAKGILLHKKCSATFSIPAGQSIRSCLGAVNLRNNAEGQIYLNRDDLKTPRQSEDSRIRNRGYLPFRFDIKGLRKVYPITSSSLTEAPQGLLGSLSQAMYSYASDCHIRLLDSQRKAQTIPKVARSLDDFLHFLNLEMYLQKFREEEIDLAVLKLFEDTDFEDLRIPEEAREKILDALPYVE